MAVGTEPELTEQGKGRPIAGRAERLLALHPRKRAVWLSSDLGFLLPVIVPVAAGAAAVTVAAAAALAADPPGWSGAVGIAALLAASLVAETFPVPIEGVAAGRTSLANIFIVGAAVNYDWRSAVLIAFVTMAAVEIGRRRRPSRIAYNTGLYTLAAAAAGGAAAAVGDGGLVSLSLAALAGSAAFYVVDIALLATVISRSGRRPLLASAGLSFYSTLAPFVIMASLAVILVMLWDRSPILSAALIAPLAAIAVYQRWVHGALERLRELDRLKNEFIAVVSHELRTPLASVYGAAMTLQRPELTEQGRESLFSVIYAESSRLARLVDQVLWASRLESGRSEAALESCDPTELTAEVVEAARAHLPPGLALELHAALPLPAVAADREKVQQVLVNLIENAVKYSPDGGRVAVALDGVNGRVRFAVEDEGLGIPVAEQERIFEKFHRLDPDLTRGVSGTGLGLYICRELVQRMNGRIWVESRVGEGSTFTFELPVAEPADP